MFYKVKLKDHVRVPPKYFSDDVAEAVIKAVREKFAGYIDEQIGFVIDVLDVDEVEDGVVIPGDGAAYYETAFSLMVFKPEMHEIVVGKVKDIADFGAFITIGPIDGMVHIGQAMDDYVSFSKEKVLTGRETNRVLKVGDECRARVIAISYKDPLNPKIGLTMRQSGLGKKEWLVSDKENKSKNKKDKDKE